MILDSSAVVGILLREPNAGDLLEKIESDRTLGIGAPTLVETAIVLASRFGADAGRLLSSFFRESAVVVIPFGEEHARIAVEAFARYGKGRHRAALNFGDCMAYAVAKLAGQPLLCTGDDFRKTDLDVV